ncbi:MAG: zinc ribbon domain-containing protein [Methanomicrobiales archaeon]|nr:zinc ribbon domain-containing protein [Methanomicrobiales archaeon]
MATCPNCGKSTPEGKFCEHCGASMQSAQTFQQPAPAQPVYTPQPVPARAEKSGGLALVLSFLFLGSGQVYNGQTGKGIGFLIGLILICWIPILPFLVWIYCLYDAYTTAQKMNRGEIPYAETSWGTVIGFIVVEIIIAIVLFLFLFALMMGSSGYYY